MFEEDSFKEEQSHNQIDDSLDQQVDDVLKQEIPQVQPSTAEPVDIENFGENDSPKYEDEEEMYQPVQENYNNEPDELHESAADIFKRKYSSPPASIYDDNTEDGRIRMSDDDNPEDTFSVSDPVKGGHVTYMVRGYDEDGPFEGSRRYNDFFNLRAAIITRWPGVYCPPIPPKKALGNKEDKFLEDRKFFLERFLLLVSKVDHLLKSDEFRLFTRPSGEIDKAVKMLPETTPDFLLQRFKTALQVNENLDNYQLNENKSLINDYQSFCKTFIKTLKHMRDQMKPFVENADRLNANYKEMVDMLGRYEEGLPSDKSRLSMTDQFEEVWSDRLTNPVREFFYWIKGEMYDLQALNDWFLGRERHIKKIQKLENKIKSDKTNLDKISQGK